MKLYSRYDLPKLLLEHNIEYGVELGVSSASFAEHLLRNHNFKELYGVDSYVDHHDVEEYKKTCRKLKPFLNHTLLRTTFDEALDFFDDDFLDFIWYDGYDYDINTLSNWFSKLKQNGIFAGRCYEEKYPKRGDKWPSNEINPLNSVESVDLFMKQHNLQLNIIEETPDKLWIHNMVKRVDKHTKKSWYTIKK